LPRLHLLLKLKLKSVAILFVTSAHTGWNDGTLCFVYKCNYTWQWLLLELH